MSFVILLLGFKKLNAVMPPDQVIVNNAMIIWHIIAYFLIMVANFLAFFFLGTKKKEEISSICVLVINLACTVILAVIVNEIVKKYLHSNLVSDADSFTSDEPHSPRSFEN